MGLAFVFGDNVDTDQIIPTNRITFDDPGHLAKYCLSGVDPEFADRFAPGDIVVAGTNIGLPVLQVPNVTEHVSDGDDLTIDVAAGTVTNETVGEELAATGLPPFVQEIVDAGGLIEYGKRTEELEDGERTN